MPMVLLNERSRVIWYFFLHTEIAIQLVSESIPSNFQFSFYKAGETDEDGYTTIILSWEAELSALDLGQFHLTIWPPPPPPPAPPQLLETKSKIEA